MPFSDPAAHPILRQALADRIRPGDTLIDCGMGCGIVGCLAREVCPGVKLVGLEIHMPYVVDPAMIAVQRREAGGVWHGLYDSLLLGEAGDLCAWLDREDELASEQCSRGNDDWVIVFGDSLEHLPQASARRAMLAARYLARHVLVSTPVAQVRDGVRYWMPQGAQYGNEHERHHHYWEHDELIALGLSLVGSAPWPSLVGVYSWDCP